VDLERASAVVGDEPVELTRQELILLDFLARNPGRVYSRTQLMEGAWESPGSATERTVDAHVKTLRAKLRAAGSDHDWVATHRGFGYSFEAEPERSRVATAPHPRASGAP
jgi:two-component system catabolic regulation response regulator CreB